MMPGRRPGRFAADAAALDERHRNPAPRQLEGDAAPDHPAAGDDDASRPWIDHPALLLSIRPVWPAVTRCLQYSILRMIGGAVSGCGGQTRAGWHDLCGIAAHDGNLRMVRGERRNGDGRWTSRPNGRGSRGDRAWDGCWRRGWRRHESGSRSPRRGCAGHRRLARSGSGIEPGAGPAGVPAGDLRPGRDRARRRRESTWQRSGRRGPRRSLRCRRSAQVAAMVETVTRHYGRIDILINNAGSWSSPRSRR